MLVADDIAVAEDILGQEDYCRDVARGCETKKMAPDRNPALCFGAIHRLGEFFVLAPPLECADTNAQERGSFLVGALQAIELFKFNKIDVRFRTCHRSPFLQKNPQFRTPVRKRETKSPHVGIPGPYFGFDGRDLAAAAGDSCGLPQTFLGHLLERAAVARESGLATREGLPTLDHDVHILGIKLQPVANTLRQLGGGQSCS